MTFLPPCPILHSMPLLPPCPSCPHAPPAPFCTPCPPCLSGPRVALHALPDPSSLLLCCSCGGSSTSGAAMEWAKLRTYTRGARRKKAAHCSSPVPGLAASALCRAGSSNANARQHLFSPPAWERHVPSNLKGNSKMKTLPKIKEKAEVAQVSNSSSSQSVQVINKEVTGMEESEDIREKSATLMKESLPINSESKESLRTTDTTSGITLPTGVSTFLLDCLDLASSKDVSVETNDSMDSCSSPETFRDDDGLDGYYSNPEAYFKCKNSTLLDTSKAVTIDKVPQLANLSEILEPVLEDLQDQYVGREKPSTCSNNPSDLTSASAVVVAGKQVCKIIPEREKTPDVTPHTLCPLPPRSKRKLDAQIAKPKNLKCKKKVKFSEQVKGGTSLSCHLESTVDHITTKAVRLTADVLSSEQPVCEKETSSAGLVTEKTRELLTSTGYFHPEDLEFNLSPVCKASSDEDLFLNTTGPYVNSAEIIPAPLSPEETTVYQSPHQRREICSIVKASPGVRPSEHCLIPVSGSVFLPPEGMPECNGNRRMFHTQMTGD
ncbi:meiosis-specific kinetochore protein isoform X3 [Alligator mississippiensis]|uniref:meiosis-specific kinetochore protein isoform X3 n=1 Tax=Alligator mississippiensis TaxID=8496 RepID=UPI0028774766|nr:meiosis-specific kinetochore protein isoform X3 [Alligator mississippiensis]